VVARDDAEYHSDSRPDAGADEQVAAEGVGASGRVQVCRKNRRKRLVTGVRSPGRVD
jgi:hypothetical protein